MGLINSPTSAAALKRVATVVADANATLAAAAGLRVMGVNVVATAGQGSTQRGQLVQGINAANSATAGFCQFSFNTGGQFCAQLPPGGVDCSGGISIDWIGGSFDVEILYLTIT